MQKLQLFFRQTVQTIEGNPLPLKRYLLLFLAILSVRLCLEFFANQRLFRLEDAVHISLWFIFIIEAFMLQLHLFTKTDPGRIVRLVVCCFSIALTAPIIDLIVSQGKFSKMNYLSIRSFGDAAWSYLTIGGASLSRGATIGIRIEIVLLVIASFNYIYLKTGKLIRAFIGTLSIYTILFLSGAVPFFLGQINALFGLSYGPADQSSVYFLFTVDLLLFLVLAGRLKRNTFGLRFSAYGFLRLVLSAGLMTWGALLALRNYPGNWVADPTTIYYFPLLLIVLCALNYYDRHGNHPDISPRRFNVQNGLFAVLLLTGWCISFHTCFAVLLSWGLQFMLYEEPLRFIRFGWLSLLLQTCHSATFLLIGFMTFGAPMIGIPVVVLTVALIGSFLIHLTAYLAQSRERNTKAYEIE
jgi:hypothetical protein